MKQFDYKGNKFYMDGEEYTILSGAMHYFRIPREYWHDRLLKLKECGFNTVETYVCWNLHEPKEGIFDFSGMLDIKAYAEEAQRIGLNMILRPGPYICAEWEFGGLPPWLLSYHNMAVRCNDNQYLEKIERYFTALFEELRPQLVTNGGNIIMVQIENEYGSYGNDKDYLAAIEKMYLELGVDVLLYTSDGSENWMLSGGTLENHLAVANFGSHPRLNFTKLRQFRTNGPLMCGEFWCGWFEHWYEDHQVVNSTRIAEDLREMCKMGASFNFYMFHGGTNFGFMNGANFNGTYQPTVTNYDYGAPLSEAGDLTPSYYFVRKVIEEYFGKLPPITVKDSVKKSYGKVSLNEYSSILTSYEKMSEPIASPVACYQEDIGQNYGFTLYSTVVKNERYELPLSFDECHDRAIFYVNGKRVGLYERDRKDFEYFLKLDRGEEAKIDILVENMGRINYGPQMMDRKGIVGIKFGQQKHFGWKMFPLEMTNDELSKVEYEEVPNEINDASFLRGTLDIDDTPCDTFIRLDGFQHGFVVVNGHNLGRYYNDAGPQRTLYCPAPFLKIGENEIIVFETDGCEKPEIEFVDRAMWR